MIVELSMDNIWLNSLMVLPSFLREKEQDARLGRRHLDIFPDHDITEVSPKFLLGGKDEINKSVVGGHLNNLSGIFPSAYLFGIPNNKCQTEIFMRMCASNDGLDF